MKIIYTNRPYARDHILNANNGIDCELNITVGGTVTKYNLYITRITLTPGREYKIEFTECAGDPAGTVTRADFFTANKIIDRLDLAAVPSTIDITRPEDGATGYISIIKN